MTGSRALTHCHGRSASDARSGSGRTQPLCLVPIGDGGNAWAAIQIHAGCGANCTHDNVISHNLIHDTPRQGIRFDGMCNVVELNRVHHSNQEQSVAREHDADGAVVTS